LQEGSDGQWERGVPAGDGSRGDPTNDADGSGQCWLTGNRPGNSDVDLGPFTLLSPVIDMTAGNATVRYSSWFHNTSITDGDRLQVYLSNNNGGSWTLVHSLAHQDGWQINTFMPGQYLTLTSQMKLKFVVSDNPNNSVTEAGIDAVTVCFEGNCGGGNGVPGDADGDGQVNVIDLLTVINGWGACVGLCPGDLNGDRVVNVQDLLMVINNWG
jgi:hypothetical protein